MSETRVTAAKGLRVAKCLFDAVRDEILPGTGVEVSKFWSEFESIVNDMAPENKLLLSERDNLQRRIDEWHTTHATNPVALEPYRAFLESIGYLLPEPADFKVQVSNVDREIAAMAGPQLVVPVDNQRFALNAANARWGSLFDAFYGTDMIAETPGLEKGSSYNERRGQVVFDRAHEFLDKYAPLANGAKYADVKQFALASNGARRTLSARLADGTTTSLANAAQLRGFNGPADAPTAILLIHNNLHFEIAIDRNSKIGRLHPAGVMDVFLEAALTTIQDCEDSVAAVDAADKTRVYRNWNGLMKGTLETTFEKAGAMLARKLNADRRYSGVDGGADVVLPGRSTLLVRHVGIHMYTDAVLDVHGNEVPEGFLDAMCTIASALHDLRAAPAASFRNSRTGSVYVVKPKQHGPAEVNFTVRLFARVERAFGLAPNTVKIGIMDEERRTTVNLKRCIWEARERVVFINTGFLDRTGDEIHTSMLAGALVRKNDMRTQPWLKAYEDWNVDIGLACGLKGFAQIGKGMWAQPDMMANMMAQKIGHPTAGATCAWVPSPTAATLHAIHYHQVDVFARQSELMSRKRASLNDILTVPLLPSGARPDDKAIANELELNAQSSLGYVARWIQFGIGCSKVPNLDDVGLMEDRATLRISSQLIANWLRHGIVCEKRVRAAFEKMAVVVDRQNAHDKAYVAMAPDSANSLSFQAALELVLQGCALPAGYTEPVLHRKRREHKAKFGPKAAL